MLSTFSRIVWRKSAKGEDHVDVPYCAVRTSIFQEYVRRGWGGDAGTHLKRYADQNANTAKTCSLRDFVDGRPNT